MPASFREIARRMDPVRPPNRLRGNGDGNEAGFADRSDKGLIEVHRWRPQHQERNRSFREIESRHADRVTTRHKFLWYNTWLLPGIPFPTPFDVLGVDLPSDVDDARRVAEKPQYKQRAAELGRELRDRNYDIVGLCEVFDERERTTIRNEWGSGSALNTAVGSTVVPGAVLGSGLYTLARDRRILRTSSRGFSTRGNSQRDSDAYSGKGVLLSEIDLGPGRIDLYTTHMFSGGGLEIPLSLDLTHSEREERQRRAEVRRSQIRELAAFVRDTHRSENVAVVAGDFNVDAACSEYATLTSEMAGLNLRDLWMTHGGDVGGTATDEDEDGPPYSLCSFDGTVPPGDRYCDDYPEATQETDSWRLDYVFLEDPQPAHQFDLDVTRVRRRPFWRGTGSPGQFHVSTDDDRPAFLSDHLGLELELIASL